MNFEEMLNSQDGAATHREQLPFGVFYKKLIGRKYRNVLELKPELADSMVFCEALKNEQRITSAMTNRQQLHYELHEDSGGVYELEIEQGSFQSFAQLIANTPSVVAKPGYIDSVIKSLLDVMELLHEQEIYHLCFAPQNIFVRKGDNSPVLLCHGSSFSKLNNLTVLFEDFKDFVAPEVFDEREMSPQSDIYSLGKFIEWLYQHGDMPFEYSKVVAKATRLDPSERYDSVSAMRSAITAKRNMRHSLMSVAAAVFVVVVCVALYFDMMPETSEVEFVEGVATEEPEDPFERGFDETTELGVWDVEPDDTLTPAERKKIEDYNNKAEEIFRKQFAKKADKILSKVYNKERMSESEKNFMASSSAMQGELEKAMSDLAGQAGLPEDKAGRIATEVLDQLTAQKQKELDKKNGTITTSPSEE